MARMYDSPQHELAKMIKKAENSGCWFYCMSTKEWFTPEDFKNLAEGLLIEHPTRQDLFVNFHVSDPKEGIRKRTAYIKKVSFELEEFTERVMTYFNFVGRNNRD